MNIMIIGASMGLGRALMDGLAQDGNTLYGVARRLPNSSSSPLTPDPQRQTALDQLRLVPARCGRPTGEPPAPTRWTY